MVERTLSIIKPDAVKAGHSGAIISEIESILTPVAMKKLHLTAEQASVFYGVHRGKPFFEELVAFMVSGPIIVMVLEGEDAISRYRTLMGATNPANAAEGTLRRKYATSLQCNAVHGSDAVETAAFETGFFFSGLELL